jgi:hypothetical protein
VKVHYLPKYSPDTNHIERVWWRLHEAVTRNHRCHTMDELLDLKFDWFETRTRFRVQASVYTKYPENEYYFRLWRALSRRILGVRRATGGSPTGHG